MVSHCAKAATDDMKNNTDMDRTLLIAMKSYLKVSIFYCPEAGFVAEVFIDLIIDYLYI